MAEDVVALLDHRKLPKASLAGWSDGGAIALDLAIHHPTRVEKMVAFATNYDLTGMRSGGGPHATFASYLQRCTADYQRLSATPKDFQPFMDDLRKMWRSQPQFTKGQLSAITAPTLVLDGEHDEIIKQDHVRELARLIPGARLHLVPEASHFAHWQRPEAFNAAVLSFLQGEPK
jgi:pimeloyl-ACP methyl ester carboxylesterase